MKKYFFFACMMTAGTALLGQDIHFSQYYASPLTLNPALTANINGVFRAAFNYRNQWFTIPTLNSVAPYQTYQVSVDAPILRERLQNDAFGFGGVFYADRAGDGALTTYSGLASIAYHKAVDRYGRARLGLGLQAGVVSKRVNIQNLVFENQLDNFGWNTSLSNGETNFNNRAIFYPDVNIGVLWTHAASDMARYYVGFAMNHLSRPRESFLGDETNRMNYRYNIHAGGEFFLDQNYNFSLSPTFLFMLQANAQQYNFGLGLNYWLSDNMAIFGGGWYRVKDAVILNVGVEFFNTRIGLSYDINHSDLRTASRAQGALEASVIYVFKKERPMSIQYEKYCPNF
ncbi:MAG: PorP/SprF family type IX secretion system membrane protein [Chitinophagales bacterium]|nr:PorP/SprF family type IX secretion system membrane protein [Chitinophagales bacterium]MDW8417766.1 PorP/SprF family type IX secretion system membrane protein [Chitinophagales bacterium]